MDIAPGADAPKRSHIRLNSHPGSRGPVRFPVTWGAATAAERGPIVATVNAGVARNAIGRHGGSYSIYRALAISSGAMDPQARPDLHDTSPVCEIGPHAQWGRAEKIVRSTRGATGSPTISPSCSPRAWTCGPPSRSPRRG
jgi:hypothetical protein